MPLDSQLKGSEYPVDIHVIENTLCIQNFMGRFIEIDQD